MGFRFVIFHECGVCAAKLTDVDRSAKESDVVRIKCYAQSFSRKKNSPEARSRLEVVVAGVSLTSILVNRNNGDVLRRLIISVRLLQSSGVLSPDGGKDGIRLLHGSGLLILAIDGARVEQDESILFGGNGSKVSLVHGILKSSDPLAVNTARAGESGGGPGAVSEGKVRKSGDDSGTGGDLSSGSTTVHVQGRGRSLDGSGREGSSRSSNTGEGDQLHGDSLNQVSM